MILSIKEIKQRQKKSLNELINYVGGPARLAKLLDVSVQVVTNWKSRGRISATMATEVERKTGGLFTRKQLRPDVIKWGEAV